jgi:DNA (cytosine-5)-methyltransferase 1
MENVPQVIGQNNIQHFAKWIEKLEQLGYKNKWQVLNAKDYGIPQNRERCFMVSILGDYYYDFPKTIPLTLRLKDMLDKEVDEKYYLSDRAINGMLNSTFNCSTLEARTEKDGVIPTLCAIDYKDPKLVIEETDKCNCIGTLQGGKWDKMHDANKRVYSAEGCSPTITTCGGGNREPKIIEDFYKNRNARIYEEISPTLRSERVGLKTVEPRILVKDATKKGYAEAHEGDSINLEQPNSKTRRGRVGRGVAQTLTTSPQQAVVEPRVIGGIGDKKSNGGTQWYQQDRVYDNELAISVTTSFNPFYKDCNYRIRKLTPKECWRLMGFEDADFEKAKNSGVSDSQLYKQAGNSIVVNVLEEIFKQMIKE